MKSKSSRTVPDRLANRKEVVLRLVVESLALKQTIGSGPRKAKERRRREKEKGRKETKERWTESGK